MQCFAHPTRAAANICSKCNHWLCDDCTVTTQGQMYCRSCLVAAGSTVHVQPPSGDYDYHDSVVSPRPSKNVNWGLLFLISLCLPPGANYMYMGLIKRGLVAMCGFFLLIYLMVTSFMVSSVSVGFSLLFVLAIPVYILTIFFDGFNVRSRINAGEVVADGISNVLNGLLRNKVLMVVLLAVIVIAFAGSLFGIAVEVTRRALPILLVCLGLYVIFRRKRNKEDDNE